MPWELRTNVSYSTKIQLSRRMGFRWATPCDTITDDRYETRNDQLTHAAWAPCSTTMQVEKLTTNIVTRIISYYKYTYSFTT